MISDTGDTRTAAKTAHDDQGEAAEWSAHYEAEQAADRDDIEQEAAEMIADQDDLLESPVDRLYPGGYRTD